YLAQVDHGGHFSVEVSVAEGGDPAVVEAATRAAVAGFLAGPLSALEVDREKRTIVLLDRIANDDPLVLADNILTFTIATGDPRLGIDDDAHILAATPEQVLAA